MKEFCFSVEKFTYVKSDDAFELDFVPKIIKRRLNKLDRITVYLLNNAYENETQNIVFSSQHGEYERLDKLIEQYVTLNEVSPNTFSSSVHNFAIGFFSILKKISIPAVATSSCLDSFSLGLLNAILTKETNTVYCFANDDFGIGFRINKTKKEFKITKKENNEQFSDIDYNRFIHFYEKKEKKISFPFYEIERIS